MTAGASRGAEPKSRRCRYPGATDGRHGRHRAKGCPQIGSQQRYTTSAGPCSPPHARRRRLPAENIVSARVLLRCHCAATSDSLRCDARSTRRAAWTASTTTEHTRRAHRMRSSDARRRFVSRTGAGVVGVESKHSESSRPRHRPRSREPGTIPPVRVRCSMTGRRGRLGGRRASTGRLRGVATLSRAPCRPEAQQSPLGTAERRLRGAL